MGIIYTSASNSTLSSLSLLTFLILILVVFRIQRTRKTWRLPPGPPGDLFIGHVRHIPLTFAWHTFAAWGQRYGPLIYVHVFGRPLLVVNTFEVARELMDKRGANFSDRARMVCVSELMGWGRSLAFLRYGERWRRQRRLVQPYFTPQAIVTYHPLIQAEIARFVGDLLDTPEKFRHHISQYVSRIVVMTTYGYAFTSDKDPRKHMVEKVGRMTVAGGNPGMSLVDLVPVLRHIPTWFPGAGFKRNALSTNALREEMLHTFYNDTKAKKAEGTANPCLILALLEKYGDEVEVNPELKDDLLNVAGVMYTAGVETTDSTISMFFLMMTRHPEFARKAQADIDEIIGRDRLPVLDDRGSLPYIDCIMKEIFRFHAPVALGIPHQSLKEDTYMGMTIPAETMVVPNIWQMMHDEQYFANPEAFNPDRHLQVAESNANAFTTVSGMRADNPSAIVFGFGRRVCPGEHLAEANVWLAIASTLALFNILPTIDPRSGRDVVPEPEIISGFTNHPKPFSCRIVPRHGHAHATSLLQHEIA